MIEHIKALFGNINLIGKDYTRALEYISSIIPLDVLNFPTGTKFETWDVPEEWVIRDAWVKFNGEKILDYKENPLCLMTYSIPFQGKLTKEEFQKHLFTSETRKNAYEYNFNFYKRDWAFSMPYHKIKEAVLNKEEQKVEVKDILQEGEYEVFIDSEFKPGILQIGVHTIKGKSDREILLFAHLDHPWQANDNLSGVTCLIDLVKQIKCEHTVKIIFCPETIGSIAYACSQDISRVDFIISVDAIGNDNTLLVQKTYDKNTKLDICANCALHDLGISFRKADFRLTIGSDEYVFNDPKIGIPAILVTRYPYDEYHTSDDTVDKILEDKIKEVQKFILKTIEIYEQDYVPERRFKAPLMRSKFNIQSSHKLLNLDMDYLWYDIDGKKSVADIASQLGCGFTYAYKVLNILKENGVISCVDNSQREVKKTRGKKQKNI